MLHQHPASPARGIERVDVDLVIADDRVTARWKIVGDGVRFPAPAPPERTDGLWRTTCFECFVKPGRQRRYYEFNFASSRAWAAYWFDGYRDGMHNLETLAPVIEPGRNDLRATFDLPVAGPWAVGLSAVIEETDGSKSYWALAHPHDKPDFHDPACFALKVPAAGTA